MLQAPGPRPGLRGEVLGRDALPTLLPAWKDLCGRSVEDNVYYSPRYARALLDSVERCRNVRFAAVWDGAGLVALLPFTRMKLALPGLRPAARAWQSKYTFSCTPLLDRHGAAEAAASLLEVLASVSNAEWIVPFVNTEGEACRALTAGLAQRGLPWAFLGRFQRAALEPGCSFDEHMKRHLSAKRRKELARQRRRLEELGKVVHEIHRFGEGLDRAISAFLDIEASGWKGERGTALACDELSRKFAVDAFTGSQADSICRADVLSLDRKPIAVSLAVFAGRTGFTVKCCYDEAYRNYGVGLLLETEVIRSFLSEAWASRLDSATTEAHVIDGFWPGRIDVADLIFSLSPRRPELYLSAFRASEQLRRSAKASIKRLVESIRAASD